MIIDPYSWQTVRILEVHRESRHAVSLRITRPNNYHFMIGQHAAIRVNLPGGTSVLRQYSFASATSADDIWLTIVKTPGGLVSSWLVDEACIGDNLAISQPFTGPLCQPDILLSAPLCLIAGGSGIAPLMSILRERRLHGRFDTTLIYSTRTDERCFESELQPQHEESIIIRDTTTTARLSNEDILTIHAQTSYTFICGSKQFVTTMRTYCDNSAPTSYIFSEAFSLI